VNSVVGKRPETVMASARAEPRPLGVPLTGPSPADTAYVMKVFTGNSNPKLAEAICKELKVQPGKIKVKRFADGEVDCQILENVRGSDVFLVQSTSTPVNENLMELLVMLDAFKVLPARSCVSLA